MDYRWDSRIEYTSLNAASPTPRNEMIELTSEIRNWRQIREGTGTLNGFGSGSESKSGEVTSPFTLGVAVLRSAEGYVFS